MRIGSLCSGIGGLDLAVEQHYGAELAWYAENDRHAATVMRRHWDAPNHGDITTIDWTQVQPVDIITAGYPCQPFSQAGKKRGKDDPRHLWPHIADCVRALRPRLVVLENVDGHIRLGAADVLADLAALGFDAKWGVVRASDAGAPHRRARWFCVAATADTKRRRPPQQLRDRAEARLPVASQHLCDRTWGRYADALQRWALAGRGAPPAPVERGKGGRLRIAAPFIEWLMGFDAGHVTDTTSGAGQGDLFGHWHADYGVPRSAQLRMLGNAVVPQQAALALNLLDGAW